jgi:hypothetical protein
MATKLVVFAVGLVMVLAAVPAPAQEPIITSQSEVTLVGCVERELDYRARVGGDASGVTDGDIVLTGAKPTAESGGATGAISGDFSLTGRLEPQLLNDLGRRVEIVGFIEDMTTNPSDEITLRRLFVKVWQAAGPCS